MAKPSRNSGDQSKSHKTTPASGPGQFHRRSDGIKNRLASVASKMKKSQAKNL